MVSKYFIGFIFCNYYLLEFFMFCGEFVDRRK